jgi:hypothetical protein
MGMAIFYLAAGAIFGLMIGLMAAASAERRKIAQQPIKVHYHYPAYVPRFDVVEDGKGNLYSLDTQTGALELLEPLIELRNIARKTKVVL